MSLDAAIVNVHAFGINLKTLHQTELFLTRLYLAGIGCGIYSSQEI
jgi:hypothetical protein